VSRTTGWATALALTATLVACSPGEARPDPAASRAPSSPTAEGEPTTAATTTPPPATPALPQVTHPVSLPALMAQEYDGRALRTRRVLAETSDYTRYAISYRSGDLRITGIMNVPRGRGPFPVLVLLHGYIDPDIYVTGQGLMREQDYLARRGYVALHVDYRNHAGSDDDPRAETRIRLGYTVDTINAVHAVRRSSLPYLDKERIGLLGRSMGGGVTYNTLVTMPGLVDAAVVFAPVSSDAGDNFDHFTRDDDDPGDSDTAARIIRRHGAPEDAPEFWRGVSPRTFFDRVTEPLLIHHGISDSTCPLRWSRRTQRELEALGKDSRLVEYAGEEHAFGPQWPVSMRRTVRFFERNLTG
jgi:dipeptidyl aminopeptidase/acylaminoacyl peptidase